MQEHNCEPRELRLEQTVERRPLYADHLRSRIIQLELICAIMPRARRQGIGDRISKIELTDFNIVRGTD